MAANDINALTALEFSYHGKQKILMIIPNLSVKGLTATLKAVFGIPRQNEIVVLANGKTTSLMSICKAPKAYQNAILSVQMSKPTKYRRTQMEHKEPTYREHTKSRKQPAEPAGSSDDVITAHSAKEVSQLVESCQDRLCVLAIVKFRGGGKDTFAVRLTLKALSRRYPSLVFIEADIDKLKGTRYAPPKESRIPIFCFWNLGNLEKVIDAATPTELTEQTMILARSKSLPNGQFPYTPPHRLDESEDEGETARTPSAQPVTPYSPHFLEDPPNYDEDKKSGPSNYRSGTETPPPRYESATSAKRMIDLASGQYDGNREATAPPLVGNTEKAVEIIYELVEKGMISEEQSKILSDLLGKEKGSAAVEQLLFLTGESLAESGRKSSFASEMTEEVKETPTIAQLQKEEEPGLRTLLSALQTHPDATQEEIRGIVHLVTNDRSMLFNFLQEAKTKESKDDVAKLIVESYRALKKVDDYEKEEDDESAEYELKRENGFARDMQKTLQEKRSFQNEEGPYENKENEDWKRLGDSLSALKRLILTASFETPQLTEESVTKLYRLAEHFSGNIWTAHDRYVESGNWEAFKKSLIDLVDFSKTPPPTRDPANDPDYAVEQEHATGAQIDVHDERLRSVLVLQQTTFDKELEIIHVFEEEGYLEHAEAEHLSNMVKNRDPVIIAACDVYCETSDWREMYDTMSRLLRREAAMQLVAKYQDKYQRAVFALLDKEEIDAEGALTLLKLLEDRNTQIIDWLSHLDTFHGLRREVNREPNLIPLVRRASQMALTPVST